MLNAFVKGQELKIVGSLVASDTIDYLEADFHFQTSDWDGASKWAHFSQGEKSFEILLTDNKIRKEDHLNLSAGDWKVYLHGNFPTGSRVTTEVKTVSVKPTGVLEGEPLPEIPLPASEQIAAQAQRAENIAQSVRDDADAGKFQGKPGPAGKDGPPGPRGETGKTGLPGSNGKPGGYYTPAVRQNSPNTIQFGFWGSEQGMPSVNSQDLYLPAGPAGERGPQGFMGATGERGPAGKTGPAGPQGISGVWVGSGDPPAGNKANVLIDPDGSPDNTLATVAYARAVAKSMDLTGMSVGDKIEVAEIDSNGVPTKWRREGTLEHLATFKTGEVKPVSIDKDDQGRPFNLSKVILRIQAPGQFKRFIAVIKLKSGALAKDYGCAPVADAETSYFVIKTETSNGYYTSAASGAKFSNEAGPSTGDAYRYCTISAKDNPIVSVGTYNECPVGVTFDVWGVRL